MSPLRLVPLVFLPLLIGALSALPEAAPGPATAQVSPVQPARLVAVQEARVPPAQTASPQASPVPIVPFVGSNVPEMGR